MNFQSWQKVLMFKMDLNSNLGGFDYGLTWTSPVAASNWLGFSPQGRADQGQSTADLGHPVQIQGLRGGGLGVNRSQATGGTPEHGGAVATARCRGTRDARLLTKRSRGQGEVEGAVRWWRRVARSPESVAELAAAARARRRTSHSLCDANAGTKTRQEMH